MKKILTLLLILAWTTSVWTTNININDPVVLVVRSVFLDGNYGTPDSVRITTWYSGSQAYDAWFNTGDSECYAANGWLAFTDTFSDIDGGGGDGSYTVIISAYDDDSTLYTDRAYSYTVGGSVESVTGAVGSVTGDIGGLAVGAIDDVWEADTSTMATAQGVGTIIKDATDLIIANLDEAISGRSAIGDTNQVDLSNYDGATPLVVGDNIGINWGDVASPGASVNLAATTVNAVTGAGITSIGQGVIDSNAINLTAWYEFWAYDDSTAPDLENALAKWLQNNLGAAGSSPWSTDSRDSMLTGLWRGSGASANIWGNNIGLNWADITNPSGTTPDVNTAKLSGGATAAANAELFFDDTGFDASNSKIGTVTLLANNAITGGSFAASALGEVGNYTIKGVIEDSSGNTSILQQTSLASGTDDIYLRQQIEFIDGNNEGYVTQISNYIGASGVVSLIPGLPAGTAAGDSFKVKGTLIGLMANVPDSVLVNVSGNSGVYADSLYRPPQTMVAEDTVTTGDTLAVKKDSLIYQGSASGLSAATIWQYEIRDDTTDGAVDDTSAADHLYSASLGGGGGTTPAAVWNYEGISDFEDSTGNDQAGQYLFSVGLHNVGQNAPTVHMKLGTAYDGTEGSNVSDDFDTTFAKLDAMGSGTGQFACSLLAYDGSNYISPAGVRMVSGAQEFRVNVSADGWAVFALDGGTWTAMVTALRFVQDTIPQTFTFSADYVDTLTMTAFSPSTPTDTGKVNLYIWTDEILGDTLEGAIFRVIPLDKGKNWVTGGNRTLLLGEVTKKTDSTGYAEIEVYQSSFVRPYPAGNDSLKYNISITYPGLSSWSQFRFAAPDTGNQYQIGVR